MKLSKKAQAFTAAVGASMIYAYVSAAGAMAGAKLGDTFDTGGGEKLVDGIKKIVDGFLTLVAIIAIIFIIIGGVQYIASAGDEKKASTAKSTILYAIIGLIIISLAGAIVRFVIDKL